MLLAECGTERNLKPSCGRPLSMQIATPRVSGLWTIALFWPVCIAVEGVAVPSSEAVPMLLLAIFSMVVCNLSISFGITKSSPFVMGVGGMLTGVCSPACVSLCPLSSTRAMCLLTLLRSLRYVSARYACSSACVSLSFNT